MKTNLYTISAATLHISVCLLIAATFFLFGQVKTAEAYITIPPTGIGLIGYAWSPNIGWVSMNCKNTNTCASQGGIDYEVRINDSGNLQGYAWSSNVGWLKFDGLSGAPVGPQASISGTFPQWDLGGITRFCSASPDVSCTGQNLNALPWDGWLALAGTATDGSTYGIDFLANGMTSDASFAWGGDTYVVGWLRFGGNGSDSVRLDPDDTVIPPPEISGFGVTSGGSPLTSGDEITFGSPAEFTFTATDATMCELTSEMPNPSGTPDPALAPVDLTETGATASVVPPLGTTDFTLTCYNGFGVTDTETFTITAKQNLIVGSFVLSDPNFGTNLNAAGVYSVISFLPPNLTGMIQGVDIPYTLDIFDSAGAVFRTVSGTVSNIGGNGTASVPGLNSFSNPLEFTNVPAGAYSAEFRVDLPVPGVVVEDVNTTPGNEDLDDNVGTIGLLPLHPPAVDVTMTTGGGGASFQPAPVLGALGGVPLGYSVLASMGPLGSDFVRFGDSYQFNLVMSAPYEAECNLAGPGVTDSVNIPIAPATGSLNSATAAITAQGEYRLLCTVINSGTGLDGLIVNDNTITLEVIPRTQEI